jgi:hypothetical protein
MLLTNARVYTLASDSVGPVVDTLVIRDRRIAFAGRRADVNPAVGEAVLDLGGRAVVPGLVDAHAHLAGSARMVKRGRGVRLMGVASEEAAAAIIAERVKSLAPGEWITGRGWDQNRWPAKQFPTRSSLDQVAPDHLVAVVRVDGHAMWVNSRALSAAGIDRETPNPSGGRIVRDPTGEPTGLLMETAQHLVEAVIPTPPPDELEGTAWRTIERCLAVGLTGVHEMGVDPAGVAAYRRLIERGRFPFRIYGAVDMPSPGAWEHFRACGPERVGDRLVIGAVKVWLDGALGSRGAALHTSYCDDPGNTGLILVPPEELEGVALEATARGFQVCVHAIGDRANTLALDAFARLQARHEVAPTARFRIEHAQVLAEADIPRFRRLGVIPSMQAAHCTSDMAWVGERLGPERLRGAYAWRSLLGTGVPIAGGSDFPVEDLNPFHGIYAAVARRPLSGEDRGWQPEQRMTRVEAVRSYTVWNAWASGQEAQLGTLAPGRQADLVVLSEDVFTCAEEDLRSIVPVLSMVAGEVVFRGDRYAG